MLRRVTRVQAIERVQAGDVPQQHSRIVSRSASPAELGLARDPRALGVAVRRISVWQGARLQTVQADDDALAAGFHAFEPDNAWRWTDGNAVLPSTLFADIRGVCRIELQVAGGTQYSLLGEACR